MSKYTIKLGDILTNLMVKEGKSAIELDNLEPFDYETDPYEVVEDTRTKFFNFEYDLYKPNDNKERLEKKILTHYYNWEIGVETPSHFKFLLRNTLNEILPYYNKLYKATEEDFNPLNNMDYEERVQGAGSNTANNTNSNTLHTVTHDEFDGSNEDEIKKSDTPQGHLDDIREGDYMSEYQLNVGTEHNEKDNDLQSTNNGTASSSGNYSNSEARFVKGINGKKSKSQLLLEYKNAIQNIDLMIIKELQSCFMQIF